MCASETQLDKIFSSTKGSEIIPAKAHLYEVSASADDESIRHNTVSPIKFAVLRRINLGESGQKATAPSAVKTSAAVATLCGAERSAGRIFMQTVSAFGMLRRRQIDVERLVRIGMWAP